jgi:multimeric flavodoxin WrbA
MKVVSLNGGPRINGNTASGNKLFEEMQKRH